MSRRVPSSFVNTANTEAQVRYQPEIDALKVLLQNAQSTHDQTVHNARAGAGIIAAAAHAAQGPLLAGYTRIMGSTNAAHAQFAQDLATVAGANSAPGIAAAGTEEAKIAADNLGLSAQAVLGMLAKQGTRAAEGAAYQTGEADRQLSSTVGQIGQQTASIQGQAGAYAAQQIAGQLSDQQKRVFDASQTKAKLANSAAISAANNATSSANNAASNATSTANNERTTAAANKRARDNKIAADLKAKNKNKGTGLPGNVKPLTTQAQNEIVNNITSAAHLISAEVDKPVTADITLPDGTVIKKGSPLNLHAMRQLLATKGNPLGRAFTTTEINSAADVSVRGGLSTPNVRALHAAGVKINGRLPTLKSTPKTKTASQTASSPLSPNYSPSLS